jgi:membrane-associated protein
MIDFILHIDQHVETFFANYKGLAILIICLILFCETGLIFMPFLPGDSLLFAVGAFVAKAGNYNIVALLFILVASVIIGDNVNYWVGKKLGTRVFDWKIPFLKKEYLDKTHQFYEKHGAKTIIMARFVPIVRTFAPFAAGLGEMTYRRYILNCIGGAILWVCSITLLGYFLGSQPWVKDNFEKVVIGIILLSVIPMIITFFKAKSSK